MVSHQKLDFIKKKYAYLSISAVMFCKRCLAYTVHIDWRYHAIHKHSCRSQHVAICVNYMHIYISTSLHHGTFKTFDELNYFIHYTNSNIGFKIVSYMKCLVLGFVAVFRCPHPYKMEEF